MENSTKQKTYKKERRALRVRSKLNGTPERPRMCVVKTNKHIHIQIIDDVSAVTLASTSTISKEFKNTEFNHRNKTSAEQLGKRIAELALAANITQVVFDRGSSKYHGILAVLADAARAAGLQF